MLTLWGASHSLYTGKVRSYLIKKGLPFRELLPSHPRFQAEVVSALRFFVVPVVETPDGVLLQDSTVIIDELERRFPSRPMVPKTPVQRVVAHLLDGFGTQGMLAAAMHYRWSYRAEQEHFLRAEFGRAVYQGTDPKQRSAAGTELMAHFSSFLPMLGISPETAPALEAAHEALLDALEIHFQHQPYLLGGCPSIADFGFMGPLYAHLARDPVPGALMKRRAPNVYRWTERMNLASIADGEFPGHAETWYPDDAIAPTLEPVLSLLFTDWGSQLAADACFTNTWLEQNPELPAGQLVSNTGERTTHPSLGTISHSLRGTNVQRGSMPYGLWHFERGALEARGLSGVDRKRFDALVQRLGGSELMKLRLSRPLLREDYVLVWG